MKQDGSLGRYHIGIHFRKAVVGRVAINTDDLIQPSRQTCHSDHDLSFTTLAARADLHLPP